MPLPVSQLNRRKAGRRMPRKPTEQYAQLAVTPEQLRKRVKAKGYSVRELRDAVGHLSHSHIYRLMNGTVKTTSIRTADVLEAVLDARGLLFTRLAVLSNDRSAA